MTSKEAQCAKAIRAELKTVFPGHKFRVRCSRYAHCTNVEVEIHESSEVIYIELNAVLDKYRIVRGTDQSDAPIRRYRDDVPQVDFVWVSTREPSEYDGVPSPDVECAKAIRAELKTTFPGHKFRVNIKPGANLTGVNIYVPSTVSESMCEDVKRVVSKYRYGAGRDIHDNAIYAFRDDVPQVQFVSVHTDDE